MNTLTDKQKELLRSNKEDLKAITLEWCKYGNGIRKSLADDFDSFASQFTVEPELERKPRFVTEHINDLQQAILCNIKDAVMNKNYAVEYLQNRI